MKNKYPIYVISKGRSDSCLTARELSKMGLDFYLVIEPSERNDYKNVSGEKIVLPRNFSEMGKGSVPVRNFVWDHSISNGDKKHWILDDNIEAFNRLNKNEKYEVKTGVIFKCCEDFTDRYSNVAISGMNYTGFCKATDKIPPYYLNTRIYSCLLIRNNINYKWRGRYNEDTDLCLRVLKDGWCTILFNAFLCGKVTTQRMRGGNTDTVYDTDDKRREFAESLRRKHPNIVDVVWKFGRWHHHVDYRHFKKHNKLKKKKNLDICDNINEYGMKLIKK